MKIKPYQVQLASLHLGYSWPPTPRRCQRRRVASLHSSEHKRKSPVLHVRISGSLYEKTHGGVVVFLEKKMFVFLHCSR